MQPIIPTGRAESSLPPQQTKRSDQLPGEVNQPSDLPNSSSTLPKDVVTTDEVSRVAFQTTQAAESRRTFVHYNRLPLESYILPEERFGVPNLNIALVILEVAEREIPECNPFISFKGSTTYAICDDNITLDWDCINDLDIRIHTTNELAWDKSRELKRKIILELQRRGLIIDIPDERPFFQPLWGIRETTGKKYDLQLSVEPISKLFDESPNMYTYSSIDIFFGTPERIALLNHEIKAQSTENIAKTSKIFYLSILKHDIEEGLSKSNLTEDKKLKILKRLYLLAILRGNNELSSKIWENYKLLRKTFNEGDYERIIGQVLPGLKDTDFLDPDIQATLNQFTGFECDLRDENISNRNNVAAVNLKAELKYPEHRLEEYQQRLIALYNSPEVFNEYLELQELAIRLASFTSADEAIEAIKTGQSWINEYETLGIKIKQIKEGPSDKKTQLETLYENANISRAANDFAEVFPEREAEWDMRDAIKFHEIIGLTTEQTLAYLTSRFYLPANLDIELLYENVNRWSEINRQK